MSETAYAFAKTAVLILLLPPGGPILLIVLGLAMLNRRPRLGRAVATFGVAFLWLFSAPLVVAALTTAFGAAHELDLEQAREAQAIVVLGAGVRQNAREYGDDTLGVLTLERIHYAAFLARETQLPILVSGGTPRRASHAEAHLMRAALENGYGISVRWTEDLSTNTRGNAVNSSLLLHRDGIKRVVLVTHAFDTRRARRHFERLGIHVLSAPTRIPILADWGWGDVLPSVRALSDSYYLGYEALAYVADLLMPDR